ncbi:hypothetical protein [Streptomyces sp. SP18BB07]|nr:hypothetical protein [Streptomyces sp. SP18BB07]MEE1764936.1 hypothetical protein [Streptomyces sp. SP18BB07]
MIVKYKETARGGLAVAIHHVIDASRESGFDADARGWSPSSSAC